ncbi:MULTISPECIES: LPD1 domain-containing protein [Polaromonas]|uniref:LPD1 domain-containing protein n=1 Tax=Polaromonas aquatica TaxID=332657 RepID=A0ABW1TZ12_9BURK
MRTKAKIEDAGEKLWGARKDVAVATGPAGPAAKSEPLLQLLWPRPEQWTELIPTLGPHRAALAMVTYENLAKQPHRHGWMGIPGEHWERAYRFAIPILREVLALPGKPELAQVVEAFDSRMREFEEFIATPPRFKNQWSFAIGRAGTRSNRHPLNFTPIDGLRARYLAEWGWGTDSRVNHSLSMGALVLKNRGTGRRYWKAVKGAAGQWAYLDAAEFETEQEALDCTRKVVNALLDRPMPAGAARGKARNNWIRPHVTQEVIRSGFTSPNSEGKTQDDLLQTFGFRGVEFGNWVTQSERQQFVDAAYDAFQDLTQLLGMPPMFASLSGKLGLAYGSRGKGLSKAAAHFEPDNWVLHMTKESGPGSLAHEFGHALDCWVADHLWGKSSWCPRFASGEVQWCDLPEAIAQSETAKALRQWALLTTPYVSDLAWIRTSVSMDRSRNTPYWSDSAEIFARAFEVLVLDSFQAKDRHNDMLVFGVSHADGLTMAGTGNPFPYPMGQERARTCEAFAAVVRAYRGEFRQSLPLTNPLPV